MPRYQIEHVLFTAAALMLGMGITGFYLFSNQITLTAMVLDLGGDEKLIQSLNQKTILFFFANFIGIVAFYAVMNIVLTHRVFGPLFAVERYLKQVLAGEKPHPIHARKNNQTADLVDVARLAGERIMKLEGRLDSSPEKKSE